MTKFPSILLIFILTLAADSIAQDSLTFERFIIKRGQKQFDLNKLTILEINQTIVSNGKDSISFSIVPDSIYKIKDTLFVKPFLVEENRLLDLDNPVSNRKYYNSRTKTILKIPLNQIQKIRAKKQPVAFILGTITTIAYITYVSSIFVAISNPKYADNGIKTFLISGAVLATIWPPYFIWGKKRFWFQSKKNKKIWSFD
jgi:hypothetical protein